MILRSLLSGFVAALLGSLSYGQPVAFFVNAETGGDGVGCGGAGSPCKSVTFMLGQIVLTPTQNAVVNLAGRIDAANNVIPYDEGNGETFPIVLPDKHSLVYDAVNSEFFPGGARVPAIVGMTQTPPTADVIQIVAVAPASIGPLTGLDGQTAGAGLRLLHVESGGNAVLVASSGATTNEAFLTGLTVRDGASTGVCIRAQDGAFTSNTVTDSTVTTNRNTSSLVKIAAANLAVPSTSTKTAVTMREVDVQVDQIGGIGVARPSVGVDIVASALVGGTPYMEFTAESVRVLGYSNGDPANPLGIDTGVYLAATGADVTTIKAAFDGGRVSTCGINGLEAAALEAGSLNASFTNLRVFDSGRRATLTDPSQGHGLSLRAFPNGTVDATVQSCSIFGHLVDGIFATPQAAPGPGSGFAAVRILGNEIYENGRDGVRIEGLFAGGFLSSSTLQSNRVHENGEVGIRLVTGGGVLSPTIVNNLIYRNAAGILVDTQGGSTASPTMTHNTVVDNTGMGVSLLGSGTAGASFWNGISWHVTVPSATDLAGFAAGQVNYTTFEVCGTVGGCTGTGNITGALATPQFVNAGASDYHLVNDDSTNPAVDRAINDPSTSMPPAAPLFDFEGDDRAIDIGNPGPAGLLADMGADEARP